MGGGAGNAVPSLEEEVGYFGADSSKSALLVLGYAVLQQKAHVELLQNVGTMVCTEVSVSEQL